MSTWPDWQPIETAPKDSIIVLTDGGQLWQGFWQTDRWFTGFTCGPLHVRLGFDPTHWMELPEGPPGAAEAYRARILAETGKTTP
jgi:hypothetical protein